VSALGLHQVGLVVMAAWTVLTVVILTRVVAPYGRHARPGWGPTMPARAAWVLFESPAVVVFLAVFLAASRPEGLVPWVLLGLWQLHYVHRTFIWPFRLRARGKRTPLIVVGAAFAFQVLNAWLNATWIAELGTYDATWLRDPRFVLGAALFLAGFGVNLHSDHILFTLRAPGESGYKVPRGGLYRWVSCPNYLGELVAWIGWALATWSLAGAAFAVYTAANLVPRALAHHRWYRDRFPDYPPERRALVPGLL